jgi:hypothetical protein
MFIKIHMSLFTNRKGQLLNILKLLSMSCALLVLMSACRFQPKTKANSKTRVVDLEAVNSPVPSEAISTKLQLTLDSPESLRVQQGDLIVKGQILVDRSAVRQQLLNRRQKVQDEVALIAATGDIPATPANTAILREQVAQAREKLRLSEVALKDYLAKSPYTDFARQTLSLPEEEKQLARLQAVKASAKAQLDQAIAQLQTIQSVQNTRQQVQSDVVSKKQQLLQELKTIETQLEALQDILSPHDAIVQGIEWKEKGKNGYKAELALAVHSSSSPIPLLPSTTNDPLLSPPTNLPAVPPGLDPLPNTSTNPGNSQLPTSVPSLQAPTPPQGSTTSSN